MVTASAARGLACLASATIAAGCSLPGTREQRYAEAELRDIPGVVAAYVACNGRDPAGDLPCAELAMADGSVLRFAGVGYRSFGPNGARVLLAEAGGRRPRVLGCEGVVNVAEIHRGGSFGRQFSPPIADVADAVRRHKEIAVKLEFWPECPQFWEHEGENGIDRYCAEPVAAPAAMPPAHPACASSLLR
jgi:hypothetical protein